MLLNIPSYIENIESIDLTLAGKCFLSAFEMQAIERADMKTGLSHGINNPFGYFLNICKQESMDRGLPVNRDFAESLMDHFGVKKTDACLNSQVISKPTKEKNPKQTFSKAQESHGPSASDTRSAIKKQIADAHERDANPIDRSGLDEFIRKHLAGEIEWPNAKAKEFADILVGAAQKNKEIVAQGGAFINPIAAWASSILSHVEITPQEARDLSPQPFHDSPPFEEDVEYNEVVLDDYSLFEEVY